MNSVLKKGLIENVINKRESFGKTTLKIINQYLLVDIMSNILNNTFDSFGEILSYKIDKNLLDEEMKTEVRCNCYHMSIDYVVMKKGKEIYVLGLDKIDVDRPVVNINHTMAYMYEKILYIPDYVEDTNFEEMLRGLDLGFANRLYVNLKKDLYSEIVKVYNHKKNDNDFKLKAENGLIQNIDLYREKGVGKLLKRVAEECTDDNGIFKAENIDLNRFVDVFEGDNKDKILKLIGTGIVEGSYIDITKNIAAYTEDKIKYLNDFSIQNENKIVTILAKEQSKVLARIQIIKDNMKIFRVYEKIGQYNREIVSVLESVKEAARINKCRKFDMYFPDTNVSYKVSANLECTKKTVECGGLEFALLQLYCKPSDKNWDIKTIISATKIVPVVIKHRNKEIWKLETDVINNINVLKEEIISLGCKLEFKAKWKL